MKLAIITPLPPAGLAEAEHALRLCQHLAAAGVDVHVLSTADSEPIDSPGVTVSPIMRKWSWTDWPRMRRFLKSVAPEAVLLFYYGPMYRRHPMITFAPTLVKRLSPKTPFVTQVSFPVGAVPAWEAPFFTRFARKMVKNWAGNADVDFSYGTLFRDSDRIIVFCEGHRRTLMEESQAVGAKSVLIPPPPFLRMADGDKSFHRQRVCRQFGFDPGDLLVMYFGYIYESKGIGTLVSAFHQAAQKQPGLRLLLVGGTPDHALSIHQNRNYVSDLRSQIAALGLEDRVGWSGDFPTGSDIGSSYLRAADFCVLPFDSGVQLNNSSLAAATAHAVPIITTRGSHLESPFVHGDTVYLCPPKDPAQMAQAIMQLAADAALRERLSTGSERLARDWFNWERVVDQTLAALQNRAKPLCPKMPHTALSAVGQ